MMILVQMVCVSKAGEVKAGPNNIMPSEVFRFDFRDSEAEGALEDGMADALADEIRKRLPGLIRYRPEAPTP